MNSLNCWMISILSVIFVSSANVWAFSIPRTSEDPPSQMSPFFTTPTPFADRLPAAPLPTPQEISDGWTKFIRHLNDYEKDDRLRVNWCDQYESTLLPSACDDFQKGLVSEWADWGSLRDLNIRAAKIWQDMVDCANGNLEQARVAYFTQSPECANSEQVRRELMDLHRQIHDFMLTTDLGQDALSSTSSTASLALINGGIFMPVHPLFSQILLELMSTLDRFVVNPRWNLPNVASGVFIEPPHSEAFFLRVAEILEGKTSGDPQRYAAARIYLNLVMAIKFLPVGKGDIAHSCADWGLWPDASAVFSYMLRVAEEGRSSLLGYQFLGAKSATCLRSELYHHVSSQLTQPALVTEFRALASRYGYPTDHRLSCYWRFPILANCESQDSGSQ